MRVSARLPVEDLEEATGVEFDREDVDTVGGLLAQRLGRVPLPGAEAEVGGLRLRAEGGEDARGRMRIVSLLVWDPETASGPEGPATTPARGRVGSTEETPEAGLVGARGEEHRG